MLLHPAILALLTGSAIVVTMSVYSSYEGIRIIRHWDYESSSRRQLLMERKTYLLSTMIAFVLSINLLGLFLYIYTVDDLHTQFVGAMCATGTLNANPIGWWVLLLKVVIFFFSAFWILVNYIDQRTETLPFVRKKYALLLLLTPLVGLDFILQLKFFLGLDPNVITSCCGALFSTSSSGIASTLSGLPIRPMMYLFFGSAVLFFILGLVSYRHHSSIIRYLLAVVAVWFLFVSMASVVSFICLYFYEIPTHHCPFDILQKEYRFVGYPLYATMLASVVFGVFPAIGELMKDRVSFSLLRWQKKWTLLSMGLLLIFCAIVLYPMIFSSFTLEGYY